jgi:drug/metabolite transporter (DMT)-like permease
MFTWGLNVVAVKFLVEHVPPVSMQAFRIFIAGLVTLIVLVILKDLRKLTKKEWVYTLIGSVLGHLVHHSLLAVGLVETSASNAALILGLIPLATAVLAIIFLQDQITFLRLLGIGLGFSGVALVVLQNNEIGTVSRGDLLVLLSMVSQAVSFIFIRKVTKTLSPKQMTSYMLLIGSVFLIGISLFLEPQGISNTLHTSGFVWAILIISAVFATGLGHILYNVAIQQIGAGQTAIFNNLVPFFALLGAVLLLEEKLYFIHIIGFFLIVAGVLLGTGYVDYIWNRKMKNSENLHQNQNGIIKG